MPKFKKKNSCIRFLFRIPRFFHIRPYRRQLNWLNVDNKRKYFLGLLILKVLDSGIPNFLAKRFVSSKDIPDLSRSVRDPAEILYIQSCSSPVFFDSFSLGGARFWNSIPRNITQKSRQTIHSFKTDLLSQK